MPIKEVYWRNPEKHKKESSERKKKLVALGYHGGTRNLSSYKRWLDITYACHKANRHVSRVGTRRYEAKVRSATNGASPWHKYLFKLMGGARAYNKRVAAGAITGEVLQLQAMQANPESTNKAGGIAKLTKNHSSTRRPLDMQHLSRTAKNSKARKKTHGPQARHRVQSTSAL